MSSPESKLEYLVARNQTDMAYQIMRYAQRHGIDVDRIVQGLGLSADYLVSAEARISSRQLNAFISRAIKVFEEPGLGLILGGEQSLTSMGLVGFGMMCCRDIQEAIEFYSEFQTRSGGYLDFYIDFNPEEIVLRTEMPYYDRELVSFYVEGAFSTMLRIGHLLTYKALVPKLITFEYERPAHWQMYEELFRCPLLFGAPNSSVVYDIKIAEIKIPSENRLTKNLVREALKKISENKSDFLDIVNFIRYRINESVESPPNIESLALALNMSSRTLRRRLDDSGIKYADLLNEIRLNRALKLFANGSARMEEVSTKLGFSDCRSFRRAFSRWTGQSPSAMKRKVNAS
ncbi:TPA: AraC family transcriptional regulator [Pseudomonas aeruginosa]|nr:AraC family transcriptional regulator [Pseudomonas aeruginosa]HCF7733168.1 AraC family transcriptional regulator [Pseudomonas aeruginosa]HCK0541297.1 AraC family transcriptional regulator [Pseudomonas aeruginosa]HEE6747507.1 AraC family transcriptional regulator [Pseudomonas aeruginosa]HEE6759898.1 AraC family transcriptional regulator [Pseudomonas aeruginosa]